ncbi:hypothetical protein EYC59_06315 [Candidatus Saccharibacteria bacterium]|nr:MAG: hypothetical protein EYC59_06315 [Candidatus Saccharibacteria bacterium]
MPKKKSTEDEPTSTPDAKKSGVEADAAAEVATATGKKLKTIDIVAIVVVTTIIAILGWTIYSKISLKHDVTAAQKVSDETITALQKRDGTTARKLGSASFQKEYTNEALTKQFKTIETATLKAPALENTTVYNSKDGKTVFFIYKYTALKVPYYVRVATLKQDGGWKLIDISGNADVSKLLVSN